MDVATMLSIFVSYGFESDDEMTDARKVEALNETYWDACSRESWPFLEVQDTLTISATTGLMTPTNGKSIGTVQAIWFSTNPRVLAPIRLDDLNQQFPNWRTANAGGTPFYYYFLADQLYLAPIPATAPTDGNIAFLQTPAELTALSVEADILIPKRFHRSVLAVGTLSRLALMQDDVDMSNAYERLYEKALALMVDDVFNRQSDRPDYIHVNDQDNWDYS